MCAPTASKLSSQAPVRYRRKYHSLMSYKKSNLIHTFIRSRPSQQVPSSLFPRVDHFRGASHSSQHPRRSMGDKQAILRSTNPLIPLPCSRGTKDVSNRAQRRGCYVRTNVRTGHRARIRSVGRSRSRGFHAIGAFRRAATRFLRRFRGAD